MMKNLHFKRFFSLWFCLCMLLSLAVGIFAADGAAFSANKTGSDTGRLNRYEKTTEKYLYDFTSTEILTYSRDEKLSNKSLRTNMIFDGSTLSCKAGKSFSFGTAIFLGDDYGVYGGSTDYKMKYEGGILSLGTRLSRPASVNDELGLWFELKDGKLSVREPISGLEVAVPYTVPGEEISVSLEDRVEKLTFKMGNETVCIVNYEAVSGKLSVSDGKGKSLGGVESSRLNPAGYMTLFADDFKGTIDDFAFEHTDLTDQTVYGDDRVLDYTNWVAIDDRQRVMPTGESVSSVKENKQVGLFYFLCAAGNDDSKFPRDITALYLERGLDGLKSYLSVKENHTSHYWAEPYFGYYRNDDAWVYRKHAYMLEAAGVDFIFLDMTNGETYSEGLVTLFDTWLQIRNEGQETPDICIFGGGKIQADLGKLRSNIFSDEGMKKYGELFYEYEGKPLILADINSDLSAENKQFLQDHFTIRGCWAWRDQNGWWSWLQEYKALGDGKFGYVNGGPGRNDKGEFEALALCIGHHPTTSKGRSYANTVGLQVKNDFGFSLDSGAGLGFAAQFEAIKYLDPNMLLITGWNEWVATLQQGKDGDTFAGMPAEGYYMVDLFNTEYSRDGEPMRLRGEDGGVGFGDNYYYQMVAAIREFKGLGKLTEATGQESIVLGEAGAFADVGPFYRDSVGDMALRHSEGFYNNTVYVNNTGRNDFDFAKVSQDSAYLYFTVSCTEDIVIDDGSNWMNLFLETDGDMTDGWEGYDFVLNRDRDGHYVSIESLQDGWKGENVGQALYHLDGKTMTVRVLKKALGVQGDLAEFSFKWADNSTSTGDVMQFMDLGDTAPNDRFAYRYVTDVNAIGAAAEQSYRLLNVDGSEVALRDECRPFVADEKSMTPSETEAESEFETESLTEKESESHTADDSDVNTEEKPSGDTEAKGCRSSVSVMGVGAVVLAATARVFGRKKKE